MLFTKEQIIGIVKNLPVSGNIVDISVMVTLLSQMTASDIGHMVYKCYIENGHLKSITDTIKSVMEEIKGE